MVNFKIITLVTKQLSQNYLILAGSSQLFVRQHDGVQEDDLARNNHVAAKDGDGGIQLAVDVEQWIVLHLGERFVRVWVLRSSLHSRPGAHSGVPANHAVENQGVFSYLRVPCRANLFKTKLGTFPNQHLPNTILSFILVPAPTLTFFPILTFGPKTAVWSTEAVS